MMTSPYFIQFGEDARLLICAGLVEAVFSGNDDRHQFGAWGKYEIQLTNFVNSFGGTEPEDSVFHDCTAQGQAIVPTMEERCIRIRDIGCVECIVAVEERRRSVN